MIVEANRIPPIHQRRLGMRRRGIVSLRTAFGAIVGCLISASRLPRREERVGLVKLGDGLHRVHTRPFMPRTYISAIRIRRLFNSRLLIDSTPFELARRRSIPAETPGSTAVGEDDTFNPPKLSS